MREWVISKLNKDRAASLSEEHSIPFFLAVLLEIRGINTKKKIDEFLCRDIKCTNISDPLSYIDMNKAVERINTAIDNFEKICIYGDYDVDGITATSLLYSYLERRNANVSYCIPRRDIDGYGLNVNRIDEFKDMGITLVITVDNGITAIEETDYAKKLGIDIVITDHHRQHEILPNAVAVVDPHRNDCTSTFKDFAGVGVVFKLVQALNGKHSDINKLFDDYSDLLALGTVADVVPIYGENRIFVKEGLTRISDTKRPGLKSLLEISGVFGKDINTSCLSFSVVPKLNVCGRLSCADSSVKLLLSKSTEESDIMAEELNRQNDERKQIEAQIMTDIEAYFKTNPQRLLDRVIVVDGENWHEGVIGILASRVMEKYGKPCIIISYNGKYAKGSGRSIEGFSLYDAVTSASRYLTRFGGHHMAAGMNLLTENIENFRIAINSYAKDKNSLIVPKLHIDCKLNINSLSPELLDQIKDMEPYGAGNPVAVFGLFGLQLTDIYPVGGGKHLRLTFEKDGVYIKAMRFHSTEYEFPFIFGDVLDLAVTIEKSSYNGIESLSIIIKDIRLSNHDNMQLIESKYDYECLLRGEYISSDKAFTLLPSRNDFTIVYRYLNKNHINGSHIDICVLYLRFSATYPIYFGKFLVILNIFREVGLIDFKLYTESCSIKLNSTDTKVNLESAQLMITLKSLVGDDIS